MIILLSILLAVSIIINIILAVLLIKKSKDLEISECQRDWGRHILY